MDTQALRLFVMAAERLNISGAGRHLGLAPAVASARLAKLENEVGADLLHRSTRKVSLSLEGAEFLPFAREMIAQEDAALSALGHGTKDVRGTIRFAASSTFAQLYIAPIIPDFLARYPHVRLDLKLSDTQANLIEGGFDLALRNSAVEDSSLRARKLAGDTRILCASPAYLDAHGTPETPTELADHRLLVFGNSRPRALTSSVTSGNAQFPPQGAPNQLMCDDGAAMTALSRAGAGISMHAVWAAHQDLESGTLKRVLPDYQVTDGSAIWLVYPKSNVLTAKVRALIDFLVEKIGKRPPWEQ